MMFSGARPTLMEIKKMFFPLPYMPYISFLRWAEGNSLNHNSRIINKFLTNKNFNFLEAVYLAEIKEYQDIYDITSGLKILGYSTNLRSQFMIDLGIVFAMAIAFRIIAVLLLYALDRSKKK